MTGWFLLAALLLLIANAFFVAVEFALLASRVTRLEPMAEDDDRRAAMVGLDQGLAVSARRRPARHHDGIARLGLRRRAGDRHADRIRDRVIRRDPVKRAPRDLVHLGAVARGGGAHGDRRDGSEEHRDRHPGALGSDPRPDSSGVRQALRPDRLVPDGGVERHHPPARYGAGRRTQHGADGQRVPSCDRGCRRGRKSRISNTISSIGRSTSGPHGGVDHGASQPDGHRPRSTSVADLEALVAESGHSRIPVTGRTLDDVVGFVHSRICCVSRLRIARFRYRSRWFGAW